MNLNLTTHKETRWQFPSVFNRQTEPVHCWLSRATSPIYTIYIPRIAVPWPLHGPHSNYIAVFYSRALVTYCYLIHDNDKRTLVTRTVGRKRDPVWLSTDIITNGKRCNEKYKRDKQNKTKILKQKLIKE